jgi:hypothetical protein
MQCTCPVEAEMGMLNLEVDQDQGVGVSSVVCGPANLQVASSSRACGAAKLPHHARRSTQQHLSISFHLDSKRYKDLPSSEAPCALT